MQYHQARKGITSNLPSHIPTCAPTPVLGDMFLLLPNTYLIPSSLLRNLISSVTTPLSFLNVSFSPGPLPLVHKCVHFSHPVPLSPSATTVWLPFTASLLEREVFANGLHSLTSHLPPHPPRGRLHLLPTETVVPPRPAGHLPMVTSNSHLTSPPHSSRQPFS